MKRLLMLLALALSTPALAQVEEDGGAYKLILIINGASVVVDYPNRQRCMSARSAAELAAEEDNSLRSMADDEPLSDGSVRRPLVRIVALCIPA